MAISSIRCPHCGRNIHRNQDMCSWCGAERPRGWARLFDWMGADPHGNWLIKAIIVANVCFYVISLLLNGHGGMGMHGMGVSGMGVSGMGDMSGMGGMSGMGNPLTFLSPSERSLLLMGATGAVPVIEMGRYWTLVAASYLHGGLLHIFFNMMALRQIGPWVSAEFGTSRMFIIYTLSGVVGYLVSCLAGVPLTIGASASVCGLIGALYYFGKSRGGNYGAAVSREVTGWLVSLLLFGLVMPGINNWAHGGGIVGGIVLGKLLGYQERGPEKTAQRLMALACMAGTVVILAWGAFEASAGPQSVVGHLIQLTVRTKG